jgi:hypothetical protein
VLLTVTDDDLYLYITAQDQVEIYFDNQPQDINKDDIAKKWQSVKVVKIPRGTRVLSVKATNLGKNPGLLASITGDRLLSDSNWKVLGSTPSNDWTSVSYNDNQWKNARVKAPYGGAPWNVKIEKISNNAKWIWSASDADSVVYFRAYLGL